MLRSLIAIVLVLTASATYSQNLSFLNRGPLSNLSDDERQMLEAAWQRALTGAEIGKREEWRNPETGNGGWIELLDTHQDFDTTCHSIRTHTEAGGLEGGGHYRVCLAEDGSWRFAPPRKHPTSEPPKTD